MAGGLGYAEFLRRRLNYSLREYVELITTGRLKDDSEITIEQIGRCEKFILCRSAKVGAGRIISDRPLDGAPDMRRIASANEQMRYQEQVVNIRVRTSTIPTADSGATLMQIYGGGVIEHTRLLTVDLELAAELLGPAFSTVDRTVEDYVSLIAASVKNFHHINTDRGALFRNEDVVNDTVQFCMLLHAKRLLDGSFLRDFLLENSEAPARR
jgi:hypothetical protein